MKNQTAIYIIVALIAFVVAYLVFGLLNPRAADNEFGYSAMQKMMQGFSGNGGMTGGNTGGATYNKSLATRTPAERKPLSYELKNGVKEFRLTAEAVNWEYAKGKTVVAWGYNGEVPGPEIRVTEGDRVRIALTNKLPKATSIHWHGLDVGNDQDGVPTVTQKAIQPGETFAYEFTAKNAGTRFYHTHGSSAMMDEAEQMDMGLAGPFIVEPRGYANTKPDREYTLVLDEWDTTGMGQAMEQMMGGSAGMMGAMNYNVFTINGRSFPGTESIKVKKGERVRLRLINAGSSTIHPMHLHGHQFKVVAVDGNAVPPAAQLTRNTQPIHPGETYDIEFVADNPGTWLFHCHELHHADGGMIAPVVYED
ncbi:MAG: copper oxidase [Candidatus Niyogibacteria bacterium]|nr:copper oxidase [Candidatus Niyogibacteria bacterium]